MRRLLAGVMLPCLMVLPACTVLPTPSETSASATGSGSPSAGASASGSAPLDRGLVPTIKDMGFATEKISAKVPGVPSLHAFTSATSLVRGQYLRGHGAATTPFALDWALIGSGADVIGVQITAHETTAKGETARASAVWFDNKTNRAVASAGLIRPGYWGQLSGRVLQATSDRHLDPGRVSASLRDQAVPLGTGPALGFARNGDLLVTFPGRTVTDEGAVLTVTVPAADAVLFLNEFGSRAQSAVKNPGTNTVRVSGSPESDPDLRPSAAPVSAATNPTPSASSATQPLGDDRPNPQLTPDCRKLRCVALSFDDGPTAETATIVKALQAANAGATFFALGDVLKSSIGPLTALAASGMEIGSHTWTHVSMASRSDADVNDQLTRNADVIEKVTGIKPMLVRPPFGAKNERVVRLVGDQGAAVTNWNIDTLDWQTRDTAKTVAAASTPQPGDIILMHDIYPTSSAAVPTILATLKQKGFTVVPISELAPPGAFQPGVAYCSSPLRKNAKC